MDNKLETISNLFEGKEIRSVWDAKKEEYFFSVVDIIGALTDSRIPRNYWSDLKRKLKEEGSQLHENIVQLKMMAKDGKMRDTDTLDTKGVLRLIESIPSSKAEPFKLWLAQIGKEDNDVFETKEKETKKLSKKKKQIIITTIILLVLIIILFSIVAYIHTRPVDWDALACSGGYTTWIFDKYSEELTSVFLNGMEEEKDKIIFIEPIRETQNAQWEDRQISIQFDIRYEHKDYGIVVERVNFIGNRYWIDSFKWNGAIIVG